MAKDQQIRTELQRLEDEWNSTKDISYASATKETFMNNIWKKQKIHKREVELLKPEITDLRKANQNLEERLRDRDKELAELKAELSATKETLNKFYGTASVKEARSASASFEPAND